jgi:hypothetical protein
MPLIPLALLAFLTGACMAAQGEPASFGPGSSLTQYAESLAKTFTIRPDRGQPAGQLASFPIPASNTRMLRIHIEVVRAPSDGSWRIEIVDPSGNTVSVHHGSIGESFWSGEVEAKNARVNIFADKSDADIELHVDKILVSTDNVVYPQGITTDRRDIRPISGETPEVRALSRAVARLRLVSAEGMGSYCTGFLVAPDILMTNEHCFTSSEVAKSAIVDFDFDSPHGEKFSASVTEFLIADFDLDYALARVTPAPQGVLPISVKTIAGSRVGQELLLVQHPNGEYKQVSRINCQVKATPVDGRAKGSDFSHLCNTLGGSSGSPIVDRASRRVVGLHHLEARPAGAVRNQGVQFELILQHLKKCRPDLHDQLTAN